MKQAEVVTTTNESDEEVEDSNVLVEELASAGINMADIKKLQDAGIYSVQGVHASTKRSLARIKGLSEAKVDKIKEAAQKLVPAVGGICCWSLILGLHDSWRVWDSPTASLLHLDR